MSTSPAYPSNLPNPEVTSINPTERRRLSDVKGPLETALLQTDYLGTQTLRFRLAEADSLSFNTFFNVTLLQGGIWFSANWPFLDATPKTRRVTAPLKWTLASDGTNDWIVDMKCQVRGLGSTTIVGGTVGNYLVIFPTNVPGRFLSRSLALLAASQASATVLPFPSAYNPGTSYFSFKTDANPVLNAFTGGASLAQAHTYVDYYYAIEVPPPQNVTSDVTGGGAVVCTFLFNNSAAVNGQVYLDREKDPVITANNVDTTPWGPFKLVSQPAPGNLVYTANYPLFLNNCTNYPSGAYGAPQVISAPFTIIRGLGD